MSDRASPLPRGRRRNGFFTYVVPAALYVAVIFYTGTRPPPPGLPRFNYADKLMHAAAFGFMVYVLRRAIAFQSPLMDSRRQLVFAVIGAAAIGGALEVVQSFTATRSAEFLDFVADVIGALIAAFLIDRLTRVEKPVDQD